MFLLDVAGGKRTGSIFTILFSCSPVAAKETVEFCTISIFTESFSSLFS